jgi:hypothetical protein
MSLLVPLCKDSRISIGAKQYLGEKMEDFFKETDKQMYLKKRFKKKI